MIHSWLSVVQLQSAVMESAIDSNQNINTIFLEQHIHPHRNLDPHHAHWPRMPSIKCIINYEITLMFWKLNFDSNKKIYIYTLPRTKRVGRSAIFDVILYFLQTHICLVQCYYEWKKNTQKVPQTVLYL